MKKTSKIWTILLISGLSWGLSSCTKDDIDDIRKELQEHDSRLPKYSSAIRFESYETADVNVLSTELKVILPDSLTSSNYNCLIATVTPASGAYTRATGNGWTVSIASPDFTQMPATATVTVKGDNTLSIGEQALLSVILTYNDGTQVAASRLVKFKFLGTTSEVTERFKAYFYDANGNVRCNKLEGFNHTEWTVAANDGLDPLEVFQNITGMEVSATDSYNYRFVSSDGQSTISITGAINAGDNAEYATMKVSIPSCPEIQTIHIGTEQYFRGTNSGNLEGPVIFLQ